jgi:hypothetical protein
MLGNKWQHMAKNKVDKFYRPHSHNTTQYVSRWTKKNSRGSRHKGHVVHHQPLNTEEVNALATDSSDITTPSARRCKVLSC